ncbi:MAG: hypothetical protein P8Z79_17615 [Sedimentisphaerales bacterium]
MFRPAVFVLREVRDWLVVLRRPIKPPIRLRLELVFVFRVVAVLDRLGMFTDRVLDDGVLHSELLRLLDPVDRFDRVVVCL